MYKVCRHIRTSGGRCRAAAVHNQNFCFYHLAQRQSTPAAAPLELPPLEDRAAIQIAISRVLAALAAGLLDRRDAGLFLYGIQIAASNFGKRCDQIEPDVDEVRRVVLTRDRQQIAEAETIFEDEDLEKTKRHQPDCQCRDCAYTETDHPHHPRCQCGQCHFFAEQTNESTEESTFENHQALTLQAVAEDKQPKELPTEKPLSRKGMASAVPEASAPEGTDLYRHSALCKPPVGLNGHATRMEDTGKAEFCRGISMKSGIRSRQSAPCKPSLSTPAKGSFIISLRYSDESDKRWCSQSHTASCGQHLPT
jgi:hypothetical protein